MRSPKLIDETGNRHNRLTVLRYAERNDRNAWWECICDCGNKTVVIGSSLRNRKVKSCGCLRSEKSSKGLAVGQAAFNAVFKKYQIEAKRRGLTWNLSKERFFNITQQPCHYCGQIPQREFSRDDLRGSFVYNGIDREDNNKGYELGNIVSCCSVCNYRKKDMPKQDFLSWIKRVYEFQHKRLENN